MRARRLRNRLTLRLRNSMSKRPVFLLHFHQIDKHVVWSRIQFGSNVIDDAFVEGQRAICGNGSRTRAIRTIGEREKGVGEKVAANRARAGIEAARGDIVTGYIMGYGLIILIFVNFVVGLYALLTWRM
jgi:hypothetical protein